MDLLALQPFWESEIGNTLTLTVPMISNKYLNVIVYSKSKNGFMYKILLNQTGVGQNVSYRNKTDTIKFIEDEWWKYYGKKTKVEFIHHDKREHTYVDSCPSTPSPRSFKRQGSLKLYQNNSDVSEVSE